MSKFLPKMYQKSIYTVNYGNLLSNGIKCILFDLDNTLCPANVKMVDDKVVDHINMLKSMGFNLLIFSNSPSVRIKPIKNKLGIDAICFARKPFKGSFKKVIKKYGLKPNQIAIIGDQLLTDVFGGNSVGFTTILIDPLSDYDGIFTLFNRFIEKSIFNKFKKNNQLEKGKYYE